MLYAQTRVTSGTTEQNLSKPSKQNHASNLKGLACESDTALELAFISGFSHAVIQARN